MPDEQTPSADDLIRRFRGSAEPVSYEDRTFEEDLNLSGIDIPVAVSFKNCTFKGTVDLSLAQTAATLDFSGSTFEKGLSLEGARIGHHLILDGCTFGSKPGKSNPTKAQQEPALNTWRTEINGDLLLRNKGTFYSHWLGRDMQIKGSFSIEGLTMEGKPRPRAQLTHARVGGGVAIHGADFGALFFQVSRIGLGFIMNDSTFTDEADFVGTSIGGQAAFSGVDFKGEVTFGQAKIEGGLFMEPGSKDNPCVIGGEASFNGASIGSQANFKGVGFKDKVVFDQAKIEGGLFMEPGGKDNPCVIGGEASFNSASIGAQANFKGVSFKDKVVFDHAKIEGSLFMEPGGGNNPCVIEGKASFNGASIGGQANFLGVSFGRPVYFQGTKIAAEINIYESTVPVLVADGSHFSKAMNINAKSEINKLVLKDAQIGTLNINWESISGNIELTGCEYNSAENKEKLLSVLLKNNVRERQPYEFLENHCREIGEVDFANDVHYKHRKQVAPLLGKILEQPYLKNISYFLWDRFIRYTTGYGVYLYRLPLCVLASFALAFGLFLCPLFVEAVGGSVERTPPWTVAMWLSIKALMPFGTSVEYTANDVWRWQPTLLGAVTINILKILVWIGISVSLMAAGGLFRAHRK